MRATGPSARGHAGWMLLVTLLVAAFNTRTIIAAVSPIAEPIDADLGLGVLGFSVVGALPPIALALFGVVTPGVVRRLSLETTMTAALAVTTLGQTVRALAGSSEGFVFGTVLALAGVGVGNVLLPPLVRRHFSGRIAVVTGLYVVAQSMGTALPAATAVPVEQAAGWRAALAVWAAASLVGLVIWIVVMSGRRHGRAHPAEIPELPGDRAPRVWRSGVAWAIAGLFAIAASHAYSAMAWLPAVLIEQTDADADAAGALLAVYGIMGAIPALLVPVIGATARRTAAAVFAGAGLLLLGYGGLAWGAGGAGLAWVLAAGLGVAYFPVCLYLINARSRTHAVTIAASAFVQSFGYAVGAVGPIAFGLLHSVTGDWTPSLVMLIVTIVVVVIAGVVLRRPRMIDDDLDRRPQAEP